MSASLSTGAVDFLRFIARAPEGAAAWQALAGRFGEDEAIARVGDLRRRGLIEAADYGPFAPSGRVVPSAYRLTVSGRDALAHHEDCLEQKRQEEACQRREKEEERAYQSEQPRKKNHHDYLVSAFQVLLGFVLGLIAEHFCQIVAFVLNLFGVHH